MLANNADLPYPVRCPVSKMVLFDAMLLICIYYANTARHLALKITEDSEEF